MCESVHRYARLPHYDLMRRVHHMGELDAEEDWASQAWSGETKDEQKRHFTKKMLAKVRTIIPMFWR